MSRSDTSRPADYGRADIVHALHAVGVRDGDVLLTHSSMATLGLPAMGLDAGAIAATFLSAVREVVGDSGTWVLPAFTYSYTKDEVFDPTRTPPTPDMGLLPNALWRHPDAVRSLDPIFSVVAIGGRARELTAGLPSSCFGESSVFARLLQLDGAICNIGIGSWSTFMHYVEQKLEVPYRQPRIFPGVSIIDGASRKTRISYNARDLDHPEHDSYGGRIDREGRAEGSVAVSRLGRGEINLIRASRLEDLIRAGLARSLDYLVVGKPGTDEQ
jgi:aminoglycoside 3-N-acetyltransferase